MSGKWKLSLTLSILISSGLLMGCGWLGGAQGQSRTPHGAILGDYWMHMTAGEKTYFVEGYRRGSAAGHIDACGLFSKRDKESLPQASTPNGIVLDPCDGLARNWSKGTEELVKQIDAFYTRFPSDREIKVTNLIQNLSDQSGLTIEQIHVMGSH